MITIQFLSGFSKRENSTKRFSGTVDMSLQGILKEPCSIMNPVIQIERLENDINPCIYTYATISSFRRMYFVDDWVWVNGLWEVHLREDVLGTWKEAIGQQTEYILRTDSTNTDFNGDITDTTYPATTDCESMMTFANSAFTSDIMSGCYIVGIISGGQTDAVGAITYFAMSSSEFGALKDMLFSDDNMQIMGIIDSSQPPQQLVQDLSYEVLKTLYNPYQYIASCMWFPFPKEAIHNKTDVSALMIGWWGYPLSGSRLYAQTLEFAENTAMHPHPQSATRGNYLNYSPYSIRTLIGRFGTIALNSSLYKMDDDIGISYYVDLITGQCRMAVRREYTESGELISDIVAERHFLLGVPIQIAQVGTDYLGTAVSALNSVPQIMSSVGAGYSQAGMVGAVINGIASTATGIYNTLQSVMPQVETGGTNGSFLAPATWTGLLEQFYKIVDEDITHRGRPLCELRQINTLSGFILCADGELDLNCFDNEREEIKRFLTTGFFWE